MKKLTAILIALAALLTGCPPADHGPRTPASSSGR